MISKLTFTSKNRWQHVPLTALPTPCQRNGVASVCAHTPSITVTSPLTPRGHNTHRHHRRAPTEYKSRWRPRVSPSTSRYSVSNLKSTSTESHRGHPTGLSGKGGGGGGLAASFLSQHPRAAAVRSRVASATYLPSSSVNHAASSNDGRNVCACRLCCVFTRS